MKALTLQIATALLISFLLFRIRHFILTIRKGKAKVVVPARARVVGSGNAGPGLVGGPQAGVVVSTMTGLFKDLDCYIDYCLARLLFWRKLRRERKRAGAGHKDW